MKPIPLLTVSLLALASCVSAFAKLPPMVDEAKAKAAEGAAKTAWTGKVGAYELCQVQNRIAATYRASAAASAGAAASAAASTPPCTDPGSFVYAEPSTAPPLEASGAHSPAATAVGPPSSKQTGADQKAGPK
ncbi:MAG: hypothetical protein M3Y32_14080 [Pseudomonadota bacterium]|nr:hypothetical protein [Pseudomonadota bacterium]